MNKPQISAAILVGGLGTRLRQVLSALPKVLAPVAGKPFLCHLLAQLAEAGLDEVVLCTGYKAELVEQTLGLKAEGVRIRYSKEEQPLGTGGALRLALDMLQGENVLLLNGDSYCGMNIRKFYAWHQAKQAPVSIAMAERPDTARYGRILVTDEGRVEAFLEKGQAGPGWINAGLYLLQREMISEIPVGAFVSIEKEIFPKWVGARKLWGYPAEVDKFIDIGTPESFEAAQKLLAGKS